MKAQRRSRSTLRPCCRLAYCCLLAASSWLACSDPRPLVIVEAGPLPAQPARLRVSLSYDGQPARMPSPIEFDLRRHRAGDTASFGIHLPLSTNGDLTIGAGVIDDGNCLAALGTGAAGPVLSQPRVSLPLLPPPADVAADARCNEPEKTPLLLRVTPSVAASRGDDSRLYLTGWGFVPAGTDCPIVTIDGNTAPNVLCPSFAELSADLPAGVGRLGKVPVRVLNRTNGRASTRRDLFGYYAKDLILSAAVAGPVMLSGSLSGLAAADLNRDGRADLVATSRSQSSIRILLNDGTGDGADAFPVPGQAQIAVGVRPAAVAIGDLSGDGLPDVAVSNGGDGTVSVLVQAMGSGGAPFVVANHLRAYANLDPDSLLLLPVDRDGRLDLAVANRLSNDISVFINDGSGALPRSGQHDYDVGRLPRSLAAGDFNGDGYSDLIVSDGSSTGYSLLLHSGSRDFVPQSAAAPSPGQALQIAAADVDGDGQSDVIRLLPGGRLEVWRGDGKGSFQSEASDSLRIPAELSAMAVGDLDMDDRPDVVAVSSQGANLYVLRNLSRSNPRPTLFQVVATLPVGPASSAPIAVSLADFDGDGLPDVAVARGGDNSIALWNNRSQ